MLKRVGETLASGGRAFGRVMPVLLRDMAGLAGIAAISYGAWLFYAPAGFITGGALLLAGTILASAKRG